MRSRFIRGPERGTTLLTLTALLSWSFASPMPADARVNPVVVVQRQIHKANMLIVFDTSGSMTGVPGGVFTYSAEAGVDCDNGSNCRQAGIAGACQISGRSCLSDDDCQRGYCSLDPTRPCGTEVDCPPPGAKCSVSGNACAADTDCPAQSGKCSATGVACAAATPCAAVGRCQYGNDICNNPGGRCPNIGLCAQDATVRCNSNAQCPQASSGGSCANGGTPPSGCSADGDCPSDARCQNTDETCRATTQCPGTTRGACSGTGTTCRNNNQCPVGQTCLLWSNPCIGPPNPCTLPHTPCTTHTNNDCTAVANTCAVPANTCQAAAVNTCVPPASLTDVCAASTRGTPGPIRMCRTAQTVCRRNQDCPSGDSCGPATSRMVIAKRAINTVVTNNFDVVNFGFMTFWQNGYFPYFQNTAGGSTGIVTEFQSKDKLIITGCYTTAFGPSPECRVSGVLMRLRSTVNSRYTVRTSATNYVDVDQSWCGDFCDIRPNIGTGEYQGSYYQYDAQTGGNSTTELEQTAYTGKNITVSGQNYTYYQAVPNYYNGGQPPPFEFTNCETTGVCSARCGGRWDGSVAPFLDTSDDPTRARDNAILLAQRFEPASYGGLMAYWSTPIGCTLENSGAPNMNASAYHYMQTVKAGNAASNIPPDPLPCRANYVVLVTDGAANGPGDIDPATGASVCATAACATADPEAAGCACRSVLAAQHMRKNLGVKTFVVGFSGDVSAGTPRIINDNIARAGGTDYGNDGVSPLAFLAQSEDELRAALEGVVYDAVRGSYSTAPTSSSAGTQQANSVLEGKYALDSRMDFPSWQGHLLAYDVTVTVPCAYDATKQCPSLAWDAATKLATQNWWERRIYTWNGTAMVKVQIDPTTKALTNKNDLSTSTLPLGATPAEAEAVARWMMGDPTYGNPAVLGAIINSTPIDVASPGDLTTFPGGHEYYLRHKDRPHLVYVGSENGMLHAFFLENTTVGTTTYGAGTEAFAFIPPDKLSTIRSLYAQGGQKADPTKHIFGLTQSPKVKTMCVRNCATATADDWATLLIMPEGYGGNETFVLDVTKPFGTNGLNATPISVKWHTNNVTSTSDRTTYNDYLGQTVSLPAFFFNKTAAMDDQRVIFTSGYPVTTGSPTQGRALFVSSAITGNVVAKYDIDPQASPNPPGSCAQEYTALTDVATARDFSKDQVQKIAAGYFGDTFGNLWRYTIAGGLAKIAGLGCAQPLHFSPMVAQLDRDDPANHAHEIYTVQVTNSTLDLETGGFAASKMIISKELIGSDATGTITSVTTDTNFGTAGKVTLAGGPSGDICAVKDVVSGACTTKMPTGARPTATPLGILRKDGSGFQAISLWYEPDPNGCTKGATYLTVHEVIGDSVTQKQGLKIANEPVTSPVILRGRVYVFGSDGAVEITAGMGTSYVPGLAQTPTAYQPSFGRLSWIEVPGDFGQ